MSLEENKQTVRRFYAEVINGRDVDACDALLAKDFQHDGEVVGLDGQKANVRVFLDGFEDLHNEIELIVAEGDLVAAHQRWSGTHTGEFAGVAATGGKVSFTSTAIIEVSDGTLTKAWDEVDVAGLMAQLTA